MFTINKAPFWKDVVYDDMWSMVNRYVCERTGIQPAIEISEDQRAIIQKAIDTIADIIITSCDINMPDLPKEQKNEEEN